LANQVPEDFLFGFKVTDAITIKKFPNLDRFGALAGKPNENFLNAELFAKAFLQPCESIRANVGLLIFEFSRFWETDYEHGGILSPTWTSFSASSTGLALCRRNAQSELVATQYFDCLARHHVTHVFQLLGSDAAVRRGKK